MKLSIIIVSYNTAELTSQTVQSIPASLIKNSELSGEIEILVVDNNSQDDSVKKLNEIKKSLPIPLTVIENKKNHGFAKANNQGIKKTKNTTVLLLNSDTIVHKGALGKMYTCLTKMQRTTGNIGIVSSRLQNPDGTFQPQGGGLPTLQALLVHQLMFDDIPIFGKRLQSTQFTGKNYQIESDNSKFESIGWVAGTTMMISRSTIDTIGLLDESIFMYGEDIEYCIRAHDHGIGVGICNLASITHVQSASSSSENAILGEIKGYLFIWSKHKPMNELSWLKKILLLGCWLRIFVFTVIEKSPSKVRIYKRALEIIK